MSNVRISQAQGVMGPFNGPQRLLGFKLHGIEELMKMLEAFPPTVAKNAMRDATRFAIKPAEESAKSTIPQGRAGAGKHMVGRKVKDGRVIKEGYPVYPPFAVSQIVKKSKNSKKKGQAYTILGVQNDAYYASQFVELGTSKQAAQPWLRPALMSNSSLIVARFMQHLGRVVKNNLKKVKKASR